MAINEACQLWIEQRIDEELEEKGEESLRTIGRTIATEIYRTFEVQMTADAIKARILRRAERRRKEALVRSEPPPSTSPPSNEIQENQVSEPSKTETVSDLPSHGGKRKGSGRLAKHTPPPIDKTTIVSESFLNVFNAMFTEVKNAKAMKWRTTSKEAAHKYVEVLLNIIQYGGK
jgi:hypothetical protein